MKKLLVLISVALILCGCSYSGGDATGFVSFRSKLQSCEQICFAADITTDYGDTLQHFSMNCTADQKGAVNFTVQSPKSLTGITGSISEDKGKLTFDDKALLFDLLVDDQLTPVSAPWLFLRILKNGYISGSSNIDNGYLIQIDDSYNGETIQMDLYTDPSFTPMGCELFWKGRRFLTVIVDNFTFM